MDQEKIGKFIASCRKELGLTQSALAEKLGITDRAVSKWETGRSLPDASIMLELCSILKIDINELFHGERFDNENYKQRAEELLIEMKSKEEKTNRTLLNLEKILAVSVCICGGLLGYVAKFVMEHSRTYGVIILIVFFIMVITCVYIGIKIEHDAGYYECPNCHYKYVPSMKAVVFSTHMGTTRKIKCPKCGKKAFHKKILTK